MRCIRLFVSLVALLLLGSTSFGTGTAESGQAEILGTYRLEVPTRPDAVHPNAVPGFEGWGVIQFARAGRDGMHFLASIETNSRNATYWLVMNPWPIVDGQPGDPTGKYQWWEIRTDDRGVGHATGAFRLPRGTWAFGGALTSDLDRFFVADFAQNIPLCFPVLEGPLGPVQVGP